MENFNNDPITSRVYKLRDEALQKAAKTVNKYARPRIIAALFEMVVSMVMTLGISIVTMLFDFSVVTTWQFWVKILLLSVCMFLLFRAVVNALFYKTSEREEAVEKRDKYKDLSDKKELDLKDYLVEFNLDTKIGTYVSKFTKRINKLERKKIRTFNQNKKMALTTKINTLKEEIKKERIDEVIDIIHVKYDVVWYDDFENIEKVGGNNGKIITRGNQAYNKAFNKASFNKMWCYVLSSAIMAISVWTFGDATPIQIIATTLSTLLMIITRIVTAFIEAPKLYDSTITASYVCKTDILKGYFKWREEKVKLAEEVKKQEELKLVEEQIKELNSEKPIEIGRGKIEVA